MLKDYYKNISRGKELYDLVRFDEALEEFNRAIELIPDEPSAHWDKAITLLAMGDYENGFEELEWRWRFSVCDNPVHIALTSNFSRWKGEDVSDKHIAIYNEWGFGDAIMMMRYIMPLINLGADISLYLPRELQRLAAQFPVRIVTAASLSDIRCESYDYVVPLMSLPRYLGIPSAPYLRVDNGATAVQTMGIAWAGRHTHHRNSERSIPLSKFFEYLPEGYLLFSIQNTEQELAGKFGIEAKRFEDFAQVAELIARMDRIVTVDTAVAHLAGALGHPNVDLLLDYAHDWRWYRGDEWYPNINRLRQTKQSDWSDVFAKLGAGHASEAA